MIAYRKMPSALGWPLWPVIALMLASGCHPALRVSDDPKTMGLPFYLSTMIYRHHSTYEYTWIRISLSTAPVLSGSGGVDKVGDPTTLTKDISNSPANRALVESLEELVANLSQSSVGAVAAADSAIYEAFRAIPALDSHELMNPPSSAIRLTANYVERIAAVDYTKRYYLNSQVPFFGSSNLAAELSPDGTLAKASNDATGGGSDAITALAGAATSVLPIKEYLTSKWVPAAPLRDSVNSGKLQLSQRVRSLVGPHTLSFKMSVGAEPHTVTFDFTSDSDTPVNGVSLPPVQANFENGTFTSQSGDKSPEKGDKDAIGFEGTVRLPTSKKP